MRHPFGRFSAVIVSVVALVGCTKANQASSDTGAAAVAAASGTTFDKSAAEKAIRQGDSLWLRSVTAKNVDSVMTLYASDAVSQQEGAPAQKGADAIRAGFTAWFKANPRDLNLTFGDIKFSDDGTLAYETGSFAGTMDGPGGKPMKEAGDYLTVYRNDGGTWKAVADMSNSTAQPGK
jgi:uncharacterized protein (TIGR02246 family)